MYRRNRAKTQHVPPRLYRGNVKGILIEKGGCALEPTPTCPGCHSELDVISASGRADDLYLCSQCYHSWFAFELDRGNEVRDPPEAPDEGDAT